ncbi:hypothetical protein Ssi03_29510 [Sphaerisporangium siamense]|uniref:Uncharacterized protein n=1 Tax=Sphaerisporangium siamense TaxID=795645 RepID=A0A7W7DFF4_9ACTN|nr:hypothetical protein [Sphaerisporangium siamense]MBB4704358.1 hypothetical protein [Sphaerisporangium siamense]GII84961.1 hypothetical protein Ssi03_29510 [Sphaerisporangium siamense]
MTSPVLNAPAPLEIPGDPPARAARSPIAGVLARLTTRARRLAGLAAILVLWQIGGRVPGSRLDKNHLFTARLAARPPDEPATPRADPPPTPPR